MELFIFSRQRLSRGSLALRKGDSLHYIRIFLMFVQAIKKGMKTTTVALGQHFDEFIRESVMGGRYTNASEVIRAGLRRLEEDEQRIAVLREAIEEGEASGYLDNFDFDARLKELKAKSRANGKD